MGVTLIVGEAWGETEEAWNAPFVGASGIELTEELADAGFLTPEDASRVCRGLYAARNGTLQPSVAVAQRDRIFRERGVSLTNCADARPPGNDISAFFLTKTEGRKRGDTPIYDRFPNEVIRRGLEGLKASIERLRPDLIVALGSTPLWALTGRDGALRWRGSQLTYSGANGGAAGAASWTCPLVPTIHPAAVLREFPLRPVVVHDLQRARHVRDEHPTSPRWDFLVRPGLEMALDRLQSLAQCRGPLVADTETIGGRITCIGLADSARRAICIPFLEPSVRDANYWPDVDAELAVIEALRQVLTTRSVVFHNGLYDCQVIQNEWGFTPNWQHDTMVAQHVAFPGLLGAGIDPVTGATSKRGSSLSLAFCASMYCQHYVFWKDDGRLYDPNTMPVEQHWRYNCEDCVRTYEVHEVLQGILQSARLLDQYAFQCRSLGPAVLRIMRRGIRVSTDLRSEELASVRGQLAALDGWFERVLGHRLNPQSNPQMKVLFYDDLRVPPQWSGKGADKRLSCDDEALDRIRSARPELSALVRRCRDYRTLAVLGAKATAANKSLLTCRLSPDDRLHFTLNLCGTETFRFSGGPNAFGEGCNPQNILKD